MTLGCSSLKSILVEDGNKNYSSDGVALYNADKTTLEIVPGGTVNFTIPNSVTSIGNYAFCLCSSLTSVTIPDSVTEIGYEAFGGCSSLASVSIPNSVTEMRNYTFIGCSSLLSVSIPNSVTVIGPGAFCYCSSLTSVTIPDSVTEIGHHSFDDCSSLTSLTIPDSVTAIGERAFNCCSSLTSLVIPESVNLILDYAFAGCSLYPLRFMGTTTSLGDEYPDFLEGLNGWIECRSKQIEHIKQFTSLPVTAWDEKYVFTGIKPLTDGIKLSVNHNAEYGSAEGDTDLCIVVSDVYGNEVKSIPVTVGQEIIISDLDAESPYTLMISWKDANGEIGTSSKLSFTTESQNGVEYVKPEVKVVGYYDITGRRYDEPIRGINIVVYSDGNTKKIVYSDR